MGFRLIGCRKGMTLIEALIAGVILVLAIYAFSTILMGSLRGLKCTGRQLAAANLLRTQIEQVHSVSYYELPPREVVVSQRPVVYGSGRIGCIIRLGQGDIVDGSVTVSLDGQKVPDSDYSVDLQRGMLYLPAALAGKPVLVDYDFRLRERQEVLRVPDTGPYKVRLSECAEKDSVRVTSESGGVTLRRVDEAAGILVFDEKDAGRTVTVTYLSSDSCTTIKSRYLKNDLSAESASDQGIKELTLEHSWVETDKEKQMAVTCLRTR